MVEQDKETEFVSKSVMVVVLLVLYGGVMVLCHCCWGLIHSSLSHYCDEKRREGKRLSVKSN